METPRTPTGKAATRKAAPQRRDGSGSGDPVDIVAILQERIANQELPSGSRLREQHLCEEFGVSRARIREAFGALEERGLIERIPHRGAVVMRLGAEQAHDLFEVREMLEGLCARLATQKAPPGHWRDLAERFGAPLTAALAAGELDAYLSAVQQLQERMLVAANNPVLRDVLHTIQDKTRVLMRRLVLLPGRAEQGLQEHRAVLRAMQQGDAAAAERLKCENMRSARDHFQRYEHLVL